MPSSLAEQPIGVRDKPELIAIAQTATSENFADALVQDTAHREHKPVKDVFVTLKLHVRQGQRKVIEHGLEEWQNQHGIDDPGYALELMLAEFHDRATFVGFISEAIVRLSHAVTAAHTQEELEQLRDVLAAHIQEMGEFLQICSGEVGIEEVA